MRKRTRSPDSEPGVDVDTGDASQPLVRELVDGASKRPNLTSTDIDDNNVARPSPVIYCSLAPHKYPIPFYTYEEHDTHYHTTHVNRCPECNRNLPMARYLALHIEENHDTFFQIRKERGEKMYGCFVEGCERRCSTPDKRRRHLIDKHFFPRTYNFSIINHGTDGLRSMLPNLRHISLSPTSMSGPTRTQDHDADRRDDTNTSSAAIDNLSAAIGNLSFMPRSVQIAKSKKSQP